MITPRSAPVSLLGLLALVVAACGGSGGGGPGGGPAPVPVTVNITSTPTLDGSVFSDGRVFPDIYPQPGHGPTGTLLQRGIYHFSLAGVPAGAQVESATIRLEQFIATTAPDAYVEMGPLLADHIDMNGLAALIPGLFAGNTLTSGFMTVATNRNPTLFNLDVTARVAADVAAGRDSSAYRLRFTNEAGAVAGNNASTFFTDGEPHNQLATVPTLVITYH
jgi:hypothetical protein